MGEKLKGKWAFIAVAAILIVVSCAKLPAAHYLPFIGDEPDDIATVGIDWDHAGDFWHNIYAPDQARLPTLVSGPFVALWQGQALFPMRVFFIGLYAGYLYLFWRLLRLKLAEGQALYGLLLTATSAYLFSFSIFTATTSNTLYLLFAVWSIYYYRRWFEGRAPQTRQIVTLGLLLGLTTASKLFGVILLAALFGFDVFVNRKKLRLRGAGLMRLRQAWYNLMFTVVWLVVNILPVTNLFKATTLVLCASVYLLITLWELKRAEHINLGLIRRWILISHTAFLVTIAASPIYLNAHNVSGVFNWFKLWNSPTMRTYISHYDIFRIIGIKFGWLAGVAVGFAIFVLAARRHLLSVVRDNALLLVITAAHLTVWASLNFTLTWYPIVIFPFLYLPLGYIFPRRFPSKTVRFRTLSIVAAAVLLLIPVHEQLRYWRLYPYGHTDGAQLGHKYVGINRPGFLTFDALPQLNQYLTQLGPQPSAGKLQCSFTDIPKLNVYAITAMNIYFDEHGQHNYSCSYQPGKETSKYLIGTAYLPVAHLRTIEQQYVLRKEFVVNTIPEMAIWERREPGQH